MKNEIAEKIKLLQTRKNLLNIEIEQELAKKKLINQRLDILNKQSGKLGQEINELKKSSAEVIISEHALLRYIERSMKVDLDSIKEKMLSDSLKKNISVCGSGKFPIDNNLRAIVKNNVMITVEPNK